MHLHLQHLHATPQSHSRNMLSRDTTRCQLIRRNRGFSIPLLSVDSKKPRVFHPFVSKKKRNWAHFWVKSGLRGKAFFLRAKWPYRKSPYMRRLVVVNMPKRTDSTHTGKYAEANRFDPHQKLPRIGNFSGKLPRI